MVYMAKQLYIDFEEYIYMLRNANPNERYILRQIILFKNSLFQIMSFFFDNFVDPFFDTFAPYHHRVDDFFRPTYYLRSIHPTEEEEEEEHKDEEEKSVVPKKTENKSLIHPYTGFGRLDVKEQDKQFIVSVDLPGVEKEDIQVLLWTLQIY